MADSPTEPKRTNNSSKESEDYEDSARVISQSKFSKEISSNNNKQTKFVETKAKIDDNKALHSANMRPIGVELDDLDSEYLFNTLSVAAKKFGIDPARFNAIARGDDPQFEFGIIKKAIESHKVTLTWPKAFYDEVYAFVLRLPKERNKRRPTVTGFVNSLLEEPISDDALRALDVDEIYKPGPGRGVGSESKIVLVKVPVELLDRFDQECIRRGVDNQLSRQDLIRSIIRKRLLSETNPSPEQRVQI